MLPTRMDFTMITYQGRTIMGNFTWIMPVPNDEHCDLRISDIYEISRSDVVSGRAPDIAKKQKENHPAAIFCSYYCFDFAICDNFVVVLSSICVHI